MLGIGKNIEKVLEFYILPNIKAKSVACGSSHTLFIDINDNLYGCGNNTHGQLGLKDIEYVYNPIFIKSNIKKALCNVNTSLILTIDGNIYISGKYKCDYNKSFIPGIVNNIRDIALTNKYIIILDYNRNLKILPYNHNSIYADLTIYSDAIYSSHSVYAFLKDYTLFIGEGDIISIPIIFKNVYKIVLNDSKNSFYIIDKYYNIYFYSYNDIYLLNQKGIVWYADKYWYFFFTGNTIYKNE